jgi:hypothetical protein
VVTFLVHSVEASIVPFGIDVESNAGPGALEEVNDPARDVDGNYCRGSRGRSFSQFLEKCDDQPDSRGRAFTRDRCQASGIRVV